MFLRQDPHALTVLVEAASDGLQQYLAGVRYQRDAPVVAAFCPILFFMEYHDDDIFPVLRHLAPLPNTNDKPLLLLYGSMALISYISINLFNCVLQCFCFVKCHEEVLSLQPMTPPKRFDISPPHRGMLLTEGLDAFQIFP